MSESNADIIVSGLQKGVSSELDALLDRHPELGQPQTVAPLTTESLDTLVNGLWGPSAQANDPISD